MDGREALETRLLCLSLISESLCLSLCLFFIDSQGRQGLEASALYIVEKAHFKIAVAGCLVLVGEGLKPSSTGS